MSFGVKYRHEFYDHFGNKIKVDILNDGYSGAVTELTGSGDPLRIHWLGEDNQIDTVIIGSIATLSVASLTNEQYVSIFTGKNREWMMKVYISTTPPAGSYVLIWQGYIDNADYKEPYVYIPYMSSIQAYDGLGDLKNLRPEFGYSSIGSFNQVNTEIYYIATVLDLIGFDFNIYINNELLHDHMSVNRLHEDVYIDFRSFIDDDNQFMNGYDILDAILKPYGARIYQSYGRWYIDRIEDKRADSTTYLIYDHTGTYTGSTTVNYKVELTRSTGSPLCVWLDHSQWLSINPAWKEFTIKQDLGVRDTILGHYDFTGVFNKANFYNFSNGVSHDMIWWTKHGGADVIKYENYGHLVLPDKQTIPTQYIQSTTITLNPAYLFALTGWVELNPLRFKCVNEFSIAGIKPYYYTALKIVFYNANAVIADNTLVVYPGSNTYTYYYEYNADNTGWSSDFKYIVQSYSGPGYQENDIVTDYILVHKSYVGYADVTSYIYGGSQTFPTTNTTSVRKHAIAIADYSNEIFEDMNTSHTINTTENIDTAYRKIPNDIEVGFGDKTIDYNNKYYNKFCKLVDTGGYVYDMTDEWTYDILCMAGIPLVSGIYRNWLLANKRQPLRILSGDLLCDYLGFHREIKDSSGRVYLPNGVEWYAKSSTWRGEWVELYTSESGEGGAFDEEAFSNSFDI